MEGQCFIFGCILGVFGTLVGIVVRRAIDARKEKWAKLEALIWRRYNENWERIKDVEARLSVEIKKMDPHGVSRELQ